MIPLRLQVKNFLSYGDETPIIDFSPYNLICLSGKNGHGKSALLDAITWALWGQARKIQGVAKADHTLLRLGQKQMMVCLDFLFDGQTYRVRREFMLTHGKPYASVDIGILDEKKDTVSSLSDKTIRKTQEKINTLIGLDYDAFINSAFLRQGQANEFSKKTAKDRKEILASILGLHRFEEIRRRAQEKVREATSQKDLFNKLQERLAQEIATHDTIKLKLIESEKQLATIANNEKILTEHEQELGKQLQNLFNIKKEAQLHHAQQDDRIARVQNEFSNTRNLINQWRATHHALLQLPDKAQLEQQKKEFSQALEAEQKKLMRTLTIKQEQIALKEQEQSTRQKIEQAFAQQQQEVVLLIQQNELNQKNNTTQLQQLAIQLDQLEKEYAAIEKQIAHISKEITANTIDSKSVDKQEKQFDKRKDFYHRYRAQLQLITNEREQIAQKKELIQNPHNPSCPLCEQNLSASRKRFLHTQLVEQEQQLAYRYRRIVGILNKLKTILTEQHAQLQKITQQNKELAVKQTQLTNHQEQQEKIAKALAETKNKKPSLEALQKKLETEQKAYEKKIVHIQKECVDTLAHNQNYQQLLQKLKDLAEQEKKHHYDEQTQQKIKQQLQDVENALNLHSQTTQQKIIQKERSGRIQEQIDIIRSIKKEIAANKKKLTAYATIETQEKELNKKQQELATQRSDLNKQKDSALQEKGSLLSQQQKLRAMEQEVKQNEKTIRTHTATVADYQEISKALGKDGIQALLIEDAIPEIEQEANDLLAKLTDNQSHINIESLRDLKKGGTRETLDINISDAAGIRPYELFSGGEAFRIDFALRIAISKLLARRAGASLQTLIIDEGFGSQDEEGLAHIMDAIYKIQDDFAKVIIVSHLSTMKDQFPVHFMVDKKSTGSTINIIEQG